MSEKEKVYRGSTNSRKLIKTEQLFKTPIKGVEYPRKGFTPQQKCS